MDKVQVVHISNHYFNSRPREWFAKEFGKCLGLRKVFGVTGIREDAKRPHSATTHQRR